MDNSHLPYDAQMRIIGHDMRGGREQTEGYRRVHNILLAFYRAPLCLSLCADSIALSHGRYRLLHYVPPYRWTEQQH